MEIRYADYRWSEEHPIFFSGDYLGSLESPYGWIGGYEDGTLRYLLPFTTHTKLCHRSILFHYGTLALDPSAPPAGEQEFLDRLIPFLRSAGIDTVVRSPLVGFFARYPEGAAHAPYGNYALDLSQPEEAIWAGMSRNHRRQIRRLQEDGYTVERGMQHLDTACDFVRATMERSGAAAPDKRLLRTMVENLADYAEIFTSFHDGRPVGSIVTLFSRYAAFCIHAGGDHAHLLDFEAIRYFRSIGVRRYDFCGAHLNAPPGSKFDGIRQFKRGFGTTEETGWIWKYSLSRTKGVVRDLYGSLRHAPGDTDAYAWSDR